jgi:hypothetical protein
MEVTGVIDIFPEILGRSFLQVHYHHLLSRNWRKQTVHELGINDSHQLSVTPAFDLSRIVLALHRTQAAGLTGGGIDVNAFIRLIIGSRFKGTNVHASLAAHTPGVFNQ